MRLYTSVVFIFYLTLCTGQSHLTGFITDAESGETLAGANIFVIDLARGAVSDNYGHFAISVPASTDTLRIRFSYVGYQDTTIAWISNENLALNIILSPITLRQITVTNHQSPGERIGHILLPIEQIKNMPTLAGEADPMKVLALLPGISQGQEGTSGLYVRGGTPDQNLILLDGATVYNVSHLFGFLSTFNPDALKKVELYKSGFPARYGGRLSSVIDLSMKEGDLQKYHTSASIGLISSHFTIEGPIKRDISSFMVAVRSSYLGLLGRFIPDTRPNYWLYDLNLKYNQYISPRTRLYAGAYFGNDLLNYTDTYYASGVTERWLQWGNKTANLRLTSSLRDNLFMDANMVFSDYRHLVRSYTLSHPDSINHFQIKVQTGSSEARTQLNFNWTGIYKHQLKFGGSVGFNRFLTNRLSLEDFHSGINIKTPDSLTITKTIPASAYLEDVWEISSLFKARIGIRASYYGVKDTSYKFIEPRLSITWLYSNDEAFQISYDRTVQFIHFASPSTLVSIGNDIWLPATKGIPPQIADIFAGGWNKKWNNTSFKTTLEVFFKRFRNQIDVREGTATFFTPGTNWEDLYETGGVGRAYGVELLCQYESKGWNGQLSYTWSQNQRRFSEINNGTWYFHKYDRRHEIELNMVRKINEKWDFSSLWVYASGARLTLPDAITPISGITSFGNFIYSSRNNAKLPDYHRLDCMFIRHSISKKGRENIFRIGVYNIYARRNPFSASVDLINLTPPKNFSYLIVQKSLFQFIPSVSYEIKL